MTPPPPTPPGSLPVSALRVAGLGVAAGIGFLLPLLAMRLAPAGRGRSVALVAAILIAILLVRRCGRMMLAQLDRVEKPWRLPLLGLYGLLALTLLALAVMIGGVGDRSAIISIRS